VSNGAALKAIDQAVLNRDGATLCLAQPNGNDLWQLGCCNLQLHQLGQEAGRIKTQAIAIYSSRYQYTDIGYAATSLLLATVHQTTAGLCDKHSIL
jgi:hypothetical protein